jgi:glutathione S-transferase
MKLYHCPNTRSERVLWMFRELGVEPEIKVIDLHKGESRQPEYLAINPNGFVPTLVDGDTTLVESAAIVLYLADKYPDKRLAPPVGTAARGLYYQYVSYAVAALDPACELVAYHTKILPEAHRVPGAAEYGRRRFARVGKACAKMLGERPYVLGADFSAADILVGSSLAWADRYGMLAELPSLSAYVARLQARPALAR